MAVHVADTRPPGRRCIIASYGDRSFARKLHSVLSGVHLRRVLLWFLPSVCSLHTVPPRIYAVQHIGLFCVRLSRRALYELTVGVFREDVLFSCASRWTNYRGVDDRATVHL